LAITGAGQNPFRFAVFHFWMRVPSDGVTDTAKPIGASRLKRLQHRLDPVSEFQVGMADDR
jgi:hypothetical protein